MFRKDPAAKAAKRRQRWLERVPDDARPAAQALLGGIGTEWELSHIDRERYGEADTETYGIVASGPLGVRCGVALSRRGAMEALRARLAGDLEPANAWAPPTADNLQVSWYSSLEALLAEGWVLSYDSESYGIGQVRATGASLRSAEASLLAVVPGQNERDAAKAALAALIAGELGTAEHWAPA